MRDTASFANLLKRHRTYIGDEGKDISLLTYKQLPAYSRRTDLENSAAAGSDSASASVGKALAEIEAMKLFTDLPVVFYHEFLQAILNTSHNPFPKLFQDRSQNVSVYLDKLQSNQSFNETNWKALGWPSQQAYGEWRNTPLRYAFSGSAHYCTPSRVFDFTGTSKTSNKDEFILLPKDSAKTTILSVAGCDFLSTGPTVRSELNAHMLQKASKKTMQQILFSAQNTGNTDIVFVPVGLGVFLPQQEPLKSQAMEEVKKGWVDALNGYQGPALNFHCCFPPPLLTDLKGRIFNPNITLVSGQGADAYTLANHLNDSGKPCLLINAGNHDWISLLDTSMGPGQLVVKGADLFTTTSDEYLALVTMLQFHSIQNYKRFKGDLVSCIKSSSEPAPVSAATSDYEEKNQASEEALAAICDILHEPSSSGDTNLPSDEPELVTNLHSPLIEEVLVSADPAPSDLLETVDPVTKSITAEHLDTVTAKSIESSHGSTPPTLVKSTIRSNLILNLLMGGLAGASVGAVIGTFLFPGIGTLIGAALGLGVGALASGVANRQRSQPKIVSIDQRIHDEANAAIGSSQGILKGLSAENPKQTSSIVSEPSLAETPESESESESESLRSQEEIESKTSINQNRVF